MGGAVNVYFGAQMIYAGAEGTLTAANTVQTSSGQ